MNERELQILIEKHITISNFPKVYKRLGKLEKEQIKKSLLGYAERLKWIDGRANLPVKVFHRIRKSNDCLDEMLKEARFSAKGVNSNFRVKLPQVMNEDLAYFLGVIAGDGYISKPKPNQRGGWVIQMCEDDYVFQTKIYIPLVKRLFGSKPKLYINKRKDGRRNYYSNLHSFIVVIYLTKILKIRNGRKVDKVQIPKAIIKHKNIRLRLAFIRGLFDTDGTVTSGRVRFSTISKKLASQVRCVLGENEIGHSENIWLKNSSSKILYTIEIRKKSLKRFNKLIGFKNNRKKKRLDRILAPSSSGQEVTS